ncbi:hypothetical protein PYW08_004262 [Mythimna loreyi]|uniref:Uncharacterized protein n=1 Tax=Mythimna loreyi TaxID=667449 RepID=A0ACC2QNC7_9NEOP|nr:hypothetical protein PYW08_004262 [Mythimna loreyi]
MRRTVFLVFVCFLQYVAGFSQMCGSNSSEFRCKTEIFGQTADYDACSMKVYPPDSKECGAMIFGPLSPNTHIGGVTLKPYIVKIRHHDSFDLNHTALNIMFSNIKWKTMKFRFQDKYRDKKNHCRDITMSNEVTINEDSVLYYDCYWPKTDDKDGQSHILDFEATAEDQTVNRGQYYFNIPSAEMLSQTTTEKRWKPFIYIEIFPTIMRLHIMPPPNQLKIRAYRIQVVTPTLRGPPRDVMAVTIPLQNNTDEVTYDYNFVGSNGSFSFVVTPLHANCDVKTGAGCKSVESPRIMISSEPQTLNICIASVTALIVATLFAYYIALRVIRRYCCHDGNRDAELAMMIPTPPKILVAYSPANRLHAECVASFVTYLRSEYGFIVMFDGDISTTSHGDPYIWAEEAFRLATHVIYIVGPAEEANICNNIYDKPIISAHKNVDTLILSFVKASRALKCSKDIINVLFEHSDGHIPVETRLAKTFTLLNDWQKLISYLSKDLLPKIHIQRSEKGRCFYEDLKRAKKLLGARNDEVIVQFENKNFEKKILL